MGLGLSRNMRDAYAFICNNYCEGDEIFLFGFSRGAYTARSVGGLIGFAGLLGKHDLDRFLELWKGLQATRTRYARASISRTVQNVPASSASASGTRSVRVGIPEDFGQVDSSSDVLRIPRHRPRRACRACLPCAGAGRAAQELRADAVDADAGGKGQRTGAQAGLVRGRSFRRRRRIRRTRPVGHHARLDGERGRPVCSAIDFDYLKTAARPVATIGRSAQLHESVEGTSWTAARRS